MTIHEFGTDNDKVIVLIHPAVVMWDYFEYVIPLLEDHYHVVVPALPGYDPEIEGDFTSVEEIAADLEDWLINKGLSRISCIYGCSMGGAIVMRMLADNRLQIDSAVLDGAITPYQLPWVATRFIAARDFMMIWMGKRGGIKALEKAFSTDEYSQEDLKYIEQVLNMMSSKTIWRTFESANNYKMPKEVSTECRKIEYWYADAEEKDRAWDIKYVKKMLPDAVFRKMENVGHGGLAPLQPERLVAGLEELIARETLTGTTGAVAAGAGTKESLNKKIAAGMCAGAALCAVFAGLLLKGYKKQ